MSNTAKIKELDWGYRAFLDEDEGPHLQEFLATPIEGLLEYSIIKYKDMDPFHLYINSSYEIAAGTLSDAQNAAQADFENKINGCLS